MGQPLMDVSVIIPVRNNLVGLKSCLTALHRQTYPADKFEVIVVDNDSTESLEKLHSEFPRVRWLYETAPSSYAARNRGLEHTQGKIVAFTDSDCLPALDWIERGVAALTGRHGTIIGGNVSLLDPLGRGLNTYETIEVIASGIPDSRRLVEERGFTTTGNLFTSRANFDRWGRFDATLKSAGDREWVTRAVRHGEKLVYADDVLVHHPRRSRFGPLTLKYRRQVGGRMMLLKRSRPTPWQLASELFLFSVFDPRIYLMAFATPLVRGPRQRLHLLGAAVLMSIATTVERFRVCFGGEASRG
jgi:glycosyltransferase involved in cell wall biosynthesis